MRRGIAVVLQRHRVSGGFSRAAEMQAFARERGRQQKAETDWVPTLLLAGQTPPPIARPAETATFFLASFDPFVFSYCVFDFPAILHRAGELGEHELLDCPESMLMSPRSLLLQPTARLRFGSERQQRLAVVLQSLLHGHDESERSPVPCARALGVQCPLLVPFLRGVCLCVETQHPFAPQAAYVFEELLTSGFVSSTLYLDGAYVDRNRTLAQLVQLAAREFGSESALFTGLLLDEEHASPPEAMAVGRLVAQTLAAADRRRLDWALKARGAVRQRLEPQHGWTLGPSPSLLSTAHQ
ncbi:hypothetical protein conserved [Leishmania donovani]|uniref:Uncharacterized protein n=3 Tax=Leishmania donovani species complex TaxID=38574 RepID=A4I149_LEIIN|nr:conserved hypothetical protein [Leishmania infantum JPCM5]XP_003861338.1 hypothetical protein, conserved [Leishmania donovani]CAC9493174.1 hypothetical_protein_-_conserved [Leishmania infantum]AYU79336.1 hypothetical protein LdCL_250005700 [Leishmania donovani]CAJ1989328.1 hypothetical protein conserved [Leishmania donovani]CAM68475.1 conserved hypothetical protein [Leishmania infantum JPCM5]CBZ34637.1 hypothetical protein, conserved [Leishmania donovani]|eukprot:XP_001466040.1 conserved hypothetical protein [Leishmania infantum JPCM5]